MRVERFEDVDGFVAAAQPFLLAREAEHNLSLGILAGLQEADGPYQDVDPLLAVVREGDDVALVAVRTPPHNLVLSVAETPAPVEPLVDALAPDPDLPGVTGPVDVATRFAARWREADGREASVAMRMRVFRTQRVEPVDDVAGRLRPATVQDRATLLEWGVAFQLEALGEETPPERAERWADRMLSDTTDRGLVVWEVDGEPVSMAGFGGPTPNGIRVFAVYTPPALRGHGYATACVAALTQQLLERGRRFCFLFTDLDNPTSNSIYRRIGYEPVVDFRELRFDRPESSPPT